MSLFSPSPILNLPTDPHFQSFSGRFFSFHGQCDLLLMRSKMFAGTGVAVHIRTTRVDNARAGILSYSYISGVAIQVGKDTLEVTDGATLLINGSEEALLPHAKNSASFAGYSVTKSFKGTNKRIHVYELDLRNGALITIRSNIHTGLMFVDVMGHFEDSEGLLGHSTNGLVSRDGSSFAEDSSTFGSSSMAAYVNSYSESWQILDTEPMLFQEVRDPQFPHGCLYESSASSASKLRGNRRLMDVGTVVTLEAAEAACAKSTGDLKQFCIDDVVAMGDMQVAEDPFYG